VDTSSDMRRHAMLTGCIPLQPSCKYSHDWYLSQEQLVTLAKNAKKAPCNFYKNGEHFEIRSLRCFTGLTYPLGVSNVLGLASDASIVLTLFSMTDGMPESVIMLLGSRVSERKQGAEMRWARRQIYLIAGFPFSAGYSAFITPRASAGLKGVSLSAISIVQLDLCVILPCSAANMHPEES